MVKRVLVLGGQRRRQDIAGSHSGDTARTAIMKDSARDVPRWLLLRLEEDCSVIYKEWLLDVTLADGFRFIGGSCRGLETLSILIGRHPNVKTSPLPISIASFLRPVACFADSPIF